ncbi:MAG: hypothetical protein IPJ18_05240 [Betaproteobacteria bacterium]|nr:hypothetical protein [Betaproteobacteria bacterium]
MPKITISFLPGPQVESVFEALPFTNKNTRGFQFAFGGKVLPPCRYLVTPVLTDAFNASYRTFVKQVMNDPANAHLFLCNRGRPFLSKHVVGLANQLFRQRLDAMTPMQASPTCDRVESGVDAVPLAMNQRKQWYEKVTRHATTPSTTSSRKTTGRI